MRRGVLLLLLSAKRSVLRSFVPEKFRPSCRRAALFRVITRTEHIENTHTIAELSYKPLKPL